MKRYDTYLFDWDGTLADTLSMWLEGYRKIFKHFSIEISDREIGRNVFGDWDFAAKYGIEDIENIIGRELRKVDERLPDSNLFTGVREVLEVLQGEDRKLGIVTTTIESNVLNVLNRKQYNPFDVIIDAKSVTKHKPDPEPVIKALQELDSTAETAVFVGDSAGDVLAGNAAGVDTVLFHVPELHGKFYDFELLRSTNPTYIISELKNLL